MNEAETGMGVDFDILVGLIGCGITQSRTPSMHMAEARAQGGRCDYRLLDMDDEANSGLSLEAMVQRVEEAGYAGVNVTYPYKIDVMALLDEMSASASAVGAVNTVTFREGRRTGHNTDMWGFAESFRRGLHDVRREHALLIGAGGAGVAVAHGLAESCKVKRLSIHDRDPARAETLAARVSEGWGIEATAISDLPALVAADRPDGVVNATPMGMDKLPGSAFPTHLLHRGMWIVDVVYFPLETELLRAARACGCRTLSGAGMAVFQAVRAFELFTGRPADPDRMRARFDAFEMKPSQLAEL